MPDKEKKSLKLSNVHVLNLNNEVFFLKQWSIFHEIFKFTTAIFIYRHFVIWLNILFNNIIIFLRRNWVPSAISVWVNRAIALRNCCCKLMFVLEHINYCLFVQEHNNYCWCLYVQLFVICGCKKIKSLEVLSIGSRGSIID